MTEPNAQSENFEEDEYFGEEQGMDEMGGYSQSEGAQMEEMEEEMEPDEFSRLGESSDDPDQKRRYLEYLSLIKEIECQNQVVEGIKSQIMEMCAKPCKTKCEVKDIKRLHTCMETEILKLRCLMEKAIELQNFGSRRRWHDIPIAATIDEENMTPYVGCIPPQSSNWKKSESSEGDKSCVSAESKEEECAMRNLCQLIKKMKVCPEDRKLIQEIAATLMYKKKKEQPPCRQKQRTSPSRKSKRPPCQQYSRSETDVMPCADSMDRLKQKISCMQSSVNKIKKEICKRQKEKEKQRECEAEKERDECPMEEITALVKCLGNRNTKSDQLEKLKQNYTHLLTEFSKKDCQLKEMEKRLKGFCGTCGGGVNNQDLQNADQSELVLLRSRVTEMKEEQTEFKCIMKEQAQQLEDYRNKYLIAQQKVEEQTVTLEKLNMNNKRIEKQINTEVKEIRAKFQEKLNELLHFPKLLENEQLKLAEVCKEKQELQAKLVLVCKELKALKAQQETDNGITDCRPQLARCQLELSQAKTKIEELERQRDMFCEQLKATQDDLDTLRSESAKIIARTKERAQMLKQQQQEQIDRLEKELAQCRATACLSVSDRESVIREMQGQLNTLSYSFDAAQKQIKTLRNHIAYVSNENCFPVKC